MRVPHGCSHHPIVTCSTVALESPSTTVTPLVGAPSVLGGSTSRIINRKRIDETKVAAKMAAPEQHVEKSKFIINLSKIGRTCYNFSRSQQILRISISPQFDF